MNETLVSDRYEAAERFVDWLAEAIVDDATGANLNTMSFDPLGLFWLGRLAPEAEVASSPLGDRAERLEPCAMGIRLAPAAESGAVVRFDVSVSFHVWTKQDSMWTKSPQISVSETVDVTLSAPTRVRCSAALKAAFAAEMTDVGRGAAIDIEIGTCREGRPEISVSLVNISTLVGASESTHARGRLFECSLRVSNLETRGFHLEALPDSFRYDRRIPAWGINCGVRCEGGLFATVDLPRMDRMRPSYWNAPDQDENSYSFARLADDPVTPGAALVDALRKWGEEAWNVERLRARHPGWTEEMTAEAVEESKGFEIEVRRMEAGLALLRSNENLCRAFRLMNEAMSLAARDGRGGYRYTSWRPFQIGFLYANLDSCLGEGSDVVDIVWFSTGGGKTETYLGLVLTAAFMDRFRGKITGITAWSRFPLRLLSLQQTQRFANALGAAEIVRRRDQIDGHPFSLGFLVGNAATPNEFKRDRDPTKRGQWDYEDDDMPTRLRMLKVCPFCMRDAIDMAFNRRYWRLEHRCRNDDCVWGTKEPLPIWVVDQEVWRYLPTVVVGTLDKAAGIAVQANMRGMVGPPLGLCPKPEHGHTYAKRASRPHGCLVPDCKEVPNVLPMGLSLYGVSFRLQDELHLLKDSLGAVDAHYEALYDSLQLEMSGTSPKILASSATLSGYDRQSEILYHRRARVFPHPEPRVGEGFWSRDTNQRMRTFLAVSPRGQTVEFATDRMMVSLQSAIRRLIACPGPIMAELGLEPHLASFLVDIYGTNVVYGNTLRDIDAVVRSAETQWDAIHEPAPRIALLTGRTEFKEVADILRDLENPNSVFAERYHVVAASSMMSHGVDIDRLNVMVMLGLPLTTSEFIQATARVGRRWPALTFVIHKIARERDASIYRAFPQYVSQGDRFVEPIPITGRSRRVLERTMPGLAFARILLLHEPKANRSIAKARVLKDYFEAHSEIVVEECDAIASFLGYDRDRVPELVEEIEEWYRSFARNLCDPANSNEWSNSLGPKGPPMLSLRDVEEQVDIKGRDPA